MLAKQMKSEDNLRLTLFGVIKNIKKGDIRSQLNYQKTQNKLYD